MAPTAAPAPAGTAPAYDADLYSDAVILDPFPHYAAMRALGPVVWLPRHGNYAITRHAEVREALRAWQAFSSAQGVAADQAGCDFLRGNTLASDPPVHDAMRVAMAAPLLPGALAGIRDQVFEAASSLVARLVQRRSFDGIADLARFLPVSLVTELVGLPEDGRENMLLWAASSFDILGVQNERGRRGVEVIREMRHWIATRATPDRLKPGSWTARIRDLAARGEIPEAFAPQLIRDYINPSLDTTISATGQLLYQLGRNPAQWALLRADRALVRGAVDEAVRLGSPIRSFSRTLSAPYVLGGVRMPRGARAMVLFASANRDERRFPDPDRFDAMRPVQDHVGFGHGIHMCVGMHLARVEMEALLAALLDQADSIQVGEPTVALNNTIHAFASLPVTLHPRRMQRGEAQRPTQAGKAAVAPKAWIAARVLARRDEAEGIVSLELGAVDGGPLPPFEAGAHVDMALGDGLVRQYSLCGDPADASRYRIAVLREPASRGGSAAVHERLHVGAELRIKSPRNLFRLDESAPASVLLAGGIGITPILAMAWRLHALGREFSLHYAARTRARAPFLGEIAASGFRNRVALHLDDGPEEARFEAARILATAPLGSHLYCCGPAGFIDAVTQAAERLAWPAPHVHVERFSATPLGDGAAFQVVAGRSGRTFDVPPGRSILEVLEAADIPVPSSCRSGVCATCLVPVLDGIPEHRDMVQTEAEKESNGQVAVCCSRSRTPVLVLDV